MALPFTKRAALAAAALVLATTTATAQVTYRLPARSASSDASAMTSVVDVIPMERVLPAPPAPVDAVASPRGLAIEFRENAQAVTELPVIVPGHPGHMPRGGLPVDLSGAGAPAGTGASGGDIEPQNYGVFSNDTIFHYNDYLADATWTYPYRAVGRLIFTFDRTSYYSCTAALINYAIMVTAAHCLYDATDGWIQEATFYPAYDSARPLNAQLFGRCNVTDATITQQWFDEGQIGNGYDVGLVVCGRLYDAVWAQFRNSVPGFRLGTLGYCSTYCERPMHMFAQIGYPANYYDGGRMTISQHPATTIIVPPTQTRTVDYVFGSGMRGGSSGGPQISNIGEISDAPSRQGQLFARNVIYAVTSWGYENTFYMIQGASPLSGVNNANSFGMMFQMTCRRARRVHGYWVCSW